MYNLMNLKNAAISKLFAADHMKNDSNEFSSPNAHACVRAHTHTLTSLNTAFYFRVNKLLTVCQVQG